ncbi:MAG: rRNA maturation RNase YbeY [Ilumatobacteraceae bacterium]
MADGPRPATSGARRYGGQGDPDVFVADEQDDVPVDLARWQALALDVLRAERVRGLAEMSLLFVTEAEITQLNERHMGKAGPTDVLSFPIDAELADVVLSAPSPSRGPDRAPPDLGDMPILLGDVVICPAVAEHQAPEHAGTLDDELALLVVHGVLHVLGHDHAADDERAVMRRRELELLEAHHWHGPAPAGFRQEQPE